MVDHVSPQKRSAIMRSIRGKHTTPELTVRKAAHALGLRFRLHSNLPGRPDIVLAKWRTVIFVNGCFWHQHVGCPRSSFPKSNRRFWQVKLRRNAERDAENCRLLTKMGWRVIVLWQCQVKTSQDATSLLAPKFSQRSRSRLSARTRS